MYKFAFFSQNFCIKKSVLKKLICVPKNTWLFYFKKLTFRLKLLIFFANNAFKKLSNTKVQRYINMKLKILKNFSSFLKYKRQLFLSIYFFMNLCA